MAPLNIMQAIVLFLGILLPVFKTTGAQSIGVCNGRQGNNLPSEQDVVRLYNDNGIKRMRLYDPLPGTLQALSGTNIELILDVPNSNLESLQDPGAATAWVNDNIIKYPDVQFRYIAVGNEVDPEKPETSSYAPFVLNAMKSVHRAIGDANLQDQIKVSTATYSGLTANTSPPSQGSFKDNAQEFMKPIIGFLVENDLPLLANIYPYFSYEANPTENLEYALFQTPDVIVPDGDLGYKNLFDALLDVMYSAVEKMDGSNIKIVVSESGWPSDRGRGATRENAQTYYKNLIDHVTTNNGTPKKPGTAIETFLFAMFDENDKTGEETEKYFGLFDPKTRQPKYDQVNFN